MAMYDICPHCGAFLDIDEKCDCQKEKVSSETIPEKSCIAKTKNRWAIEDFKITH